MQSTTLRRDTDSICSHIVRSIAAETETDPLELQPPLYYTVDVEAIQRLLDGDAPVTVEFEYNGHDVVVHDSLEVIVDGTVYRR